MGGKIQAFHELKRRQRSNSVRKERKLLNQKFEENEKGRGPRQEKQMWHSGRREGWGGSLKALG